MARNIPERLFPIPFSSKGFTLIELLVVITIVSLLSSFLLLFLNPYKQINKARDAQREQSFKQITTALETYYNDIACFPASLPFGGTFVQGATVYMKKVPQDPSCEVGGKCFAYIADNASCPQWSVLFAKLSSVSTVIIPCPLEQMIGCLPANYFSSGYNFCTISGKVDCSYIQSQTLP